MRFLWLAVLSLSRDDVGFRAGFGVHTSMLRRCVDAEVTIATFHTSFLTVCSNRVGFSTGDQTADNTDDAAAMMWTALFESEELKSCSPLRRLVMTGWHCRCYSTTVLRKGDGERYGNSSASGGSSTSHCTHRAIVGFVYLNRLVGRELGCCVLV
ncbi:hypothetical protein C8F01DRAFT_489512 [Mycena amicta]|nr:hypothetical protein C8F01DRAFT_489512 [Mycena amicta]